MPPRSFHARLRHEVYEMLPRAALRSLRTLLRLSYVIFAPHGSMMPPASRDF